MSILNVLSRNETTINLTAPISMRGLERFSITQPIKIIFNLPTSHRGPLIDFTDCRYSVVDMLHIENIGYPAACGVLLARSSPTASCSNNSFRNITIEGNYTVSALMLIGAELITVNNSYFKSSGLGSSAIRIVASNRNPENTSRPLVISPFGPIAENPDGTMASVSQSVVRMEACGATVSAGPGSNTVRIGQGTASITWIGGSLSANVAGSKSAFKIGEIGGTKCQQISILGRPQIESPLDGTVRRLDHGIYIDNPVEGFYTELGLTAANHLITERVPGLIR